MGEIQRASFDKSLRKLTMDTPVEEIEEALRDIMFAVKRRGEEIERTCMRLATRGSRMMNEEEKLAQAEKQLEELLAEEKSKEAIFSVKEKQKKEEEENESLMCDDRSDSPNELLFDSVPDECSPNPEETLQASSGAVYYFLPLDDDVPCLSTPPNRRSLIRTIFSTGSRAPSRSSSRCRTVRK